MKRLSVLILVVVFGLVGWALPAGAEKVRLTDDQMDNVAAGSNGPPLWEIGGGGGFAVDSLGGGGGGGHIQFFEDGIHLGGGGGGDLSYMSWGVGGGAGGGINVYPRNPLNGNTNNVVQKWFGGGGGFNTP